MRLRPLTTTLTLLAVMSLAGCTAGERSRPQPSPTVPARTATGSSLTVADGYHVSTVQSTRLLPRDAEAALPPDLLVVGSPFEIETDAADGRTLLRLDIENPEGPQDSKIAASYGLAKQGPRRQWKLLPVRTSTRSRLSVAGVEDGSRLVVFRRDWAHMGDAVDQAGVARLVGPRQPARCRQSAAPPAWAKFTVARNDPDVASCIESRDGNVVLRLFSNSPGNLMVSAARPFVDWVAFDGGSSPQTVRRFPGLLPSEALLPARGSVSITISRGSRVTERLSVRPTVTTVFADVLSSAMDATSATAPATRARRFLVRCATQTQVARSVDKRLTTVASARRSLRAAADGRLRPCLKGMVVRNILDASTAQQVAAVFAALVNFGHRDPHFQTAWAPLRRLIERMLEWNFTPILMRFDNEGGRGVALADTLGDVRKTNSWSSPLGYAPDIRFVEFVNRGDKLGARVQVAGALDGRILVEISNAGAGPEDAALQLSVRVRDGRVARPSASYYREVSVRSRCTLTTEADASTRTVSLLVSQRCLKSDELFQVFKFDDAVMLVESNSHTYNLTDEAGPTPVPHLR